MNDPEHMTEAFVSVDWSTFVRTTPLSDDSFDYAAREVAQMGVTSGSHGAVVELIGDARLHRKRLARLLRAVKTVLAGWPRDEWGWCEFCDWNNTDSRRHEPDCPASILRAAMEAGE